MEDNISNTYDSNGEEEEDADVVMENEEEIQDALLKRDPDNGISDDVVPHDTNDETDISLTTSSKNTTKSLFLHWKDFIFDVISEIQSPTQPISTEVSHVSYSDRAVHFCVSNNIDQWHTGGLNRNNNYKLSQVVNHSLN